MASELHLSESVPFGQTSRFAKGVSFQALTEISDENCYNNKLNANTNAMIVNNGSATVISKSSSSDSDTNDSHTRLLEDSLQDFRSVRYLLLTPTTTHTTTCLSDDPSNPSDALWTQMQNSLSKEIRNRYLTKKRCNRMVRREYTLIGLHCYPSAIKMVFSVTLGVILCTFVLLMLILFVWRHNQFSSANSVSDIPDQNWWRGSTFYEIFVASFKDSDGDGFGDLNGLRDKISYLKELGIHAIRLNSIFSALDYPHRYDNVLDFYSVDPHIGKFTDFVDLVKVLHESNIYIILDINIVLTSDQHPWAAHWLSNRTGEYQYFYVNVSDDQIIDKDWTSSSATDRLKTDFLDRDAHFGGRLHLNWSHPVVRHKMWEVFDFWLQYIDGFYLKRLENLYIDSEAQLYDILTELRLRANIRHSGQGVGQTTPKILIGSSQFVQKRHKLLLNYIRDPLAPNDLRMSTTTNNSTRVVDINAFFDLIDFQLEIDINKTESIRDQVNAIFLNSPPKPSIHWSVGDVDRSRLATRIGTQYIPTASFLLIMLPGTISLFYGDEIGLQDINDPDSGKEYRGGQLCPMQWTPHLNANFSQSNTTKPWLPIHPNYTQINVLNQNESIKRFNQLTTFRADNLEVEDMGKHGNYLFHYIDDNLIVFERYFDKGVPIDIRFRYVLFANFGPKPKVKDFSDKFHFSFIKISSFAKREKEFLYMRSLRLDSGEALIVEVE